MEWAALAGKLITDAVLRIPFVIGVISGAVAVVAVSFALYVAASWQAGFYIGARVKPDPEPDDLSGIA